MTVDVRLLIVYTKAITRAASPDNHDRRRQAAEREHIMTYFARKSALHPITSETWEHVSSAVGTECQVQDYAHDYGVTFAEAREAVYSKYEGLDLEQMYQIADLAPDWDCEDPEFFEEMADIIGYDASEDDSVEPLMDAVADYLRRN